MKKLLTCIGALVGLCLIMVVIGMIYNATPQGQAALTASAPTKVIAVKPTATVVAAVKRTATQVAAEVTVQESPEQIYRFRMASMYLSCSGYLSDMSKLSISAGDDSTLFFDNKWRIKVTTALLGMKTSCAVVDEVGPVPEKFNSYHSLVTLAANEYDLVITNYAEGIDERSVDKIESATQHMNKAADYGDLANAEFEKVAEK